MKLLRVGAKGAEKPAILAEDGTIRDLSGIVPDLVGAALSDESLERIRGVDASTLPQLSADERIGPCVGQVGKFICIGLNYADHAAETGAPIPAEPIVFSKAPSCLCGPNDDVIMPRGSVKLDWEVELAVVIGKRCDYVEEKDALDHVLGYALCNDVSERAYQAERGGQWIKGKSAPTFGPLGPWIATTDEIGEPQNLDMFLDVNGKRCQTGNTKTMIFSVAHVVSYLSQFMVLEPGDVITTGTPPGVGLGMKPPVFLNVGDTMRLGIAGLGEQNQKVVAR